MGIVSRIRVPSSNTKVDNINDILVAFNSQEYVSWFYIPVDKAFGVDIPNRRNPRRKKCEMRETEGN